MEEKTKLYEKIEFLGEGQFATVYKARDVVRDRIVAVKKIKLGTRQEAADGINRTALREIKLLQELSHPNIIGLLDVFGQKSNVSLVFDFMETDLEIIIKENSIIFTPAHIKSYIMQTLRGLEYLHANWILHRDMKPNNLLINDEGVLKLGDFGLAKFYGSPNRIYTHQVVTRWYRCPELLFGARNYGTGVDMWAVGCILAELLLRIPFLPGDSDLDQLSKIFQVLGTPTKATWPKMESLPDYVQFKPSPGTALKDIFIAASDDLLELLGKMLTMDPCKRITAASALQCSYFYNRPLPTPGHLLPRINGGNKNQNLNNKPSLKRKLEGDSGGLVKRSNTRQAVQPQKMVGGSKFGIYNDEGLYLYYLCSENKDTDQLGCYRAADMCLRVYQCKKQVFSRGSFDMMLQMLYTTEDDDDKAKKNMYVCFLLHLEKY